MTLLERGKDLKDQEVKKGAPIAGTTTSWIADPKTGCAVSNPNPIPNDSMTWSGACNKDRRAEGQGVLEWRLDGNWYRREEGTFKDGERNGRFTDTSPSGDRVEATYRDDLLNGQYIRQDADGVRVEGQTRNSEFIGNVTVILANGDRYVGEYRIGRGRHGQGTYNYSNGDQYVGGWKDGEKYGYGVGDYTFGDGSSYKGELQNGEWRGYGVVNKPDADYAYRYEGHFGDGTVLGTSTWVNRDRYVGPHKDDKRHGVGVCNVSNHAPFICEFNNGKQVRTTKQQVQNGSRSE